MLGVMFALTRRRGFEIHRLKHLICVSRLLERGVGYSWKGTAFVISGLSQYCYLQRDMLFILERKRCSVSILRCHLHLCCSWDFIPNYSSLHVAVHQDRTLHRRQQLLKRNQGLPGNTTTNTQNTGRSPPAAESQPEDQKHNIPGTNRVRSHQAQASSHPLRAPVGLEIPSCTAAPTRLSSPYHKESKGAFNTLGLQGTDRRW